MQIHFNDAYELLTSSSDYLNRMLQHEAAGSVIGLQPKVGSLGEVRRARASMMKVWWLRRQRGWWQAGPFRVEKRARVLLLLLLLLLVRRGDRGQRRQVEHAVGQVVVAPGRCESVH